jgi:hypothetical protein
MGLHRTAALAAGALALSASGAAAADRTNFTLFLLKDYVDNARCLDGTPGAYYVRPGVGENATKCEFSSWRPG